MPTEKTKKSYSSVSFYHIWHHKIMFFYFIETHQYNMWKEKWKFSSSMKF